MANSLLNSISSLGGNVPDTSQATIDAQWSGYNPAHITQSKLDDLLKNNRTYFDDGSMGWDSDAGWNPTGTNNGLFDIIRKDPNKYFAEQNLNHIFRYDPASGMVNTYYDPANNKDSFMEQAMLMAGIGGVGALSGGFGLSELFGGFGGGSAGGMSSGADMFGNFDMGSGIGGTSGFTGGSAGAGSMGAGADVFGNFDMGSGLGGTSGFTGGSAGAGTGSWTDFFSNAVKSIMPGGGSGTPGGIGLGDILKTGGNYLFNQMASDRAEDMMNMAYTRGDALNQPQRQPYQQLALDLLQNPQNYLANNPFAKALGDRFKNNIIPASVAKSGNPSMVLDQSGSAFANAIAGNYNNLAQILSGYGGFQHAPGGSGTAAGFGNQALGAQNESFRGFGSLLEKGFPNIFNQGNTNSAGGTFNNKIFS